MSFTIRHVWALAVLQDRFHKEGSFHCPADDEAGIILGVAGYEVTYVDDSSIMSTAPLPKSAP